MKVSIFTPTHDSQYLNDVYQTIKDQSFDEWVILYNNGANRINFNDHRVKEFSIDIGNGNIGTYKRLACMNCTGDILVELDHDDFLVAGAVDEVRKAFADPDIGFVYSNSLYTDMRFGKPQRFLTEHGWQYRETQYNGHLLDEPISFPPTPANVSRIWYAPDHLRSFRKNAYAKAGGYDANLRVLDDQDLMCRLYLETNFCHIDKGLYVYRVHGDNSWILRNKEIQDGVYPLYDKYIEPMAIKWAASNGLEAIDLGGGLNKPVAYKSVDLKNADVLANLNNDWPFEDGSVGVVRAYDILEHLKDPLHSMTELYRVLAPGGYAFIQVPSTDGRGAFQDPTHVSFWNENSFLYYTNKMWSQYVDTPVRFQAIRLYTTEKNNIDVCWTMAHLVKLDDQKVAGLVLV